MDIILTGPASEATTFFVPEWSILALMLLFGALQVAAFTRMGR